MYLGDLPVKPAVMPDREFIALVRDQFPVAVDAPPIIEQPKIFIPPDLVRTTEVVRDPYTGEWKHPSDVYPVAPAYAATTTVSMPGATPNWIWAAGAVGVGLLIWMVFNAK